MILRTKYGQDFNTEKIWGVEYGFIIDGKNGEYIHWTKWKSYISQRRMLQALNDLKKGDCCASGYHWRPVHINYDFEMRNLSDKSLREYKLKQLLEKN